MIGVDMSLEYHFDFVSVILHHFEQGIGTPGADGLGGPVEIQHRVDDDS